MRKDKDTGITPQSEETKMRSLRSSEAPYTGFDEMDRWFEELRRNAFGGRGLAVPGAEDAISPTWVRQPLVDLADEGREFVVRAELPGVAKEDVDLDVTADGIEIRARSDRQREAEDEDYYFRERNYCALRRTLPFPAEVLADQAQASLKDGVLEVRVPKKEPTPERKPVKVRVE